MHFQSEESFHDQETTRVFLQYSLDSKWRRKIGAGRHCATLCLFHLTRILALMSQGGVIQPKEYIGHRFLLQQECLLLMLLSSYLSETFFGNPSIFECRSQDTCNSMSLEEGALEDPCLLLHPAQTQSQTKTTSLPLISFDKYYCQQVFGWRRKQLD